MPRSPAASALAVRQRRPTSSSSTAQIACDCRQTLPSRPPSLTRIANASTSTAPATTATAPSPVLDFLCPTFGFFSRALPPTLTPTAAATSWVLSAPPPHSFSPRPSSSASSSASSSSFPLAAFAAPPPPPPRPQPQAFDVRSWRAAEGLAVLRVATHLPTSTSRARPRGMIGMGSRCVCGRVRQSCLRCRSASTSAVRTSSSEEVGQDDEAALAGWKGKGKEAERREEDSVHGLTGSPSRRESGVGASEGSRTAVSASKRRRQAEQEAETGVRETDTQKEGVTGRSRISLETVEPSLPPSARLSRLLQLYVLTSLPSVRGSSTPTSARPSSRMSGRQRSQRSGVHEQVEGWISSLWREVEHASFVEELTPQEQLDLVRAFSRLARSLVVSPTDVVDPLVKTQTVRTRTTAKRLEIQQQASTYMLALLNRLHLWSPSRSVPSRLPETSTTYTSAALLFLDAACLAKAPPSFADALAHSSTTDTLTSSAMPSSASSNSVSLRTALSAVFFSPPPPLGLPSDKRRRTLLTQRGYQKTALTALFTLWERVAFSMGRRGSAIASEAVQLLHGWGVARAFAFEEGEGKKEEAFNDTLRRRYGALLALLKPSPAEWLVKRARSPGGPASVVDPAAVGGGESLGTHLVFFLARTESSVAALEAWRTVEELTRQQQGQGGTPMDEVVRLRTLTALVDGLTVEKLYEDANALAVELEKVASSVQAEAGLHEHEGAPDVEVVVDAYRVLAKLSSEQGNDAELERLLERLAGVRPPSPQSSDSGSEAVARRMRARSSSMRNDPVGVQQIFDEALAALSPSSSNPSTDSPTPFSPSDRARLCSQLVLAYSRVNDPDRALQTLQDLIASGLDAPLSALNATLYGYARRGDVRTTFNLFSQLVEGAFPGLQPNANSWNALVLVAANARDPVSTEGVIEQMKEGGIAPTRQTWTTLMSAYVASGQWRQVLSVFRHLDQQTHPLLKPDTAAVNVMLRACVLAAVPAEKVLRLFQAHISRGFRPDMKTYTLVMQSVCAAGLMDVAEELFLVLDKQAVFGRGSVKSAFKLPPSLGAIAPDQHIFASLIGGYIRSGQAGKARILLSEMRARGIKPNSVTIAVVLGARLVSHRERLQDYTVHGVRSVLQQTREFLADDDLETRRRTQPVTYDRHLAEGSEAIPLLAQVIKAMGKTSLKGEVFEVFEEAIFARSLTGTEKEGPIPIDLYTAFMDALKRGDRPDDVFTDVWAVWRRLHSLVSDRHIGLYPPDSLFPSFSFVDSEKPLVRRVDPAHSTILCAPLTILIQTLSQTEHRYLLEITWRRLAREGFVFDASNWNALAQYFARDLQIDRALWIVENVLTTPQTNPLSDDSPSPSFTPSLTPAPAPSFSPSPMPSPTTFLDEVTVQRAHAVGRVPSRLRALRAAEIHKHRKDPIFLTNLLSPSTRSPLHVSSSSSSDLDTDTDAMAEPDSNDSTTPPFDSPSPSTDPLTGAFLESYATSAATFWHPFGATLQRIEEALETLSASSTAEDWKGYLYARRSARRKWLRKFEKWATTKTGEVTESDFGEAGEREIDEMDEMDEEKAMGVEGEESFEGYQEEDAEEIVLDADLYLRPKEEREPVPEDGTAARAELLKKYPRAARSIELWKTRNQRRYEEKEAYARTKRGGGGGLAL